MMKMDIFERKGQIKGEQVILSPSDKSVGV